jgi:hypothetical protein
VPELRAKPSLNYTVVELRRGAILERVRPRGDVDKQDIQGGLSEDEKRSNLIRLVFENRVDRFEQFCREVEAVVPFGTTVIIRGSAITGTRWKDQSPFDADGPGTSDIDLTLVGADALHFFTVDGFFVPGVHSRPLSDDDPDIAPDLVPLRRRLMAMVHRPVNIQASRDIVLQFRGDLLDQPYLTLFHKPDRPTLREVPMEHR